MECTQAVIQFSENAYTLEFEGAVDKFVLLATAFGQ